MDQCIRRAEDCTADLGDNVAAISRRRHSSGEKFRITLQGAAFASRADAGKRLMELVNEQFAVVQKSIHPTQEAIAGELGGFTVLTTVERVMATTEIRITLQGAPQGELRFS